MYGIMFACRKCDCQCHFYIKSSGVTVKVLLLHHVIGYVVFVSVMLWDP